MGRVSPGFESGASVLACVPKYARDESLGLASRGGMLYF